MEFYFKGKNKIVVLLIRNTNKEQGESPVLCFTKITG